MNTAFAIRGPLLNPRSDGSAYWCPDGGIVSDDRGRIEHIGEWHSVARRIGKSIPVRVSKGVILPPFVDAHTHIPQFPIRGRFLDGVTPDAEGGPLVAGLNRNVFPVEARCADPAEAERVVRAFLADTLAHGVVGGAAYMTVHPAAARVALDILPATWQVGLVLMNMNCPPYLRTDEATVEADLDALATEFGSRLIVTDRFAPAVDSPLRRRAVALSEKLGLRMQTHLNEQLTEKALVEKTLYPHADNYTDVYRRDGLLARSPILAHCVRMRGEEFDTVAAFPGVAIAHCPTSNTLLGSGVMPLDEVRGRGIPYSICTDIGASPTTSLLCEMLQFLRAHAGRSAAATPEEALFRITHAPAQILGSDGTLGTLEAGKPLTFVEVTAGKSNASSASAAILTHLLDTDAGQIAANQEARREAMEALVRSGLVPGATLDTLTNDILRSSTDLDEKVLRVTIKGRTAWERENP